MKKETIITAAGIGGGQLIVLAATPYLARVYDATEFGILASIMVASNAIAAVAGLKFDAAVPAVKQPHVDSVFQLSLLAALVTCSIFYGLLAWLAPHIPVLDDFLGSLSAPQLLLASLFQAFVASSLALRTRLGDFAGYAVLRVLQPLFFVAIVTVSQVGLVWGFVFGWLVSACLSLCYCRQAIQAIRWKDLLESARTYRSFAIYNAPSSLLQMTAIALPMLYVMNIFGEGEAGNYSQILRIGIAPAMLLALASGQVFYKYAGDSHRGGSSISKNIVQQLQLMAAVSAALLVFFWLFGSGFVELMLGSGWKTDTLYLVLVAATGIPRIIGSPVSTAYFILNKQKALSLWHTGYFFSMVALLAGLPASVSVNQFLVSLLLLDMLMYGVMVIYAFYASANTGRLGTANGCGQIRTGGEQLVDDEN